MNTIEHKEGRPIMESNQLNKKTPKRKRSSRQLAAALGAVALLGSAFIAAKGGMNVRHNDAFALGDFADETAFFVESNPTAQSKSFVVPTDEANAKPVLLIKEGTNETGNIVLTVNRSQVIRTTVPVSRISIAQPAVADAQPLSPNMILVTAKAAGSTQLILWDDKDQSQVVDMTVKQDLAVLEQEIKATVPNSEIKVSSVNGTIALRGRASSLPDAQKAVALSEPFGPVLNFIEVSGGQQVVLQVTFAEVSRSVTNTLGVNWGFEGAGGLTFGSNTGTGDLLGLAGLAGGLNGPEDIISNIFGTGSVNGNRFAYFLTMLKSNNLMRTLAEPNQVVLSGEEGELLAGGELPVPIPSQDGIGIEYKKFGVRLKYKPVVLGNGRIRLAVEAEVSDVDESIGTPIAGGIVSGFTTRNSRTTVELGEGQTLPIAGLLNDKVIASRNSVPGLGNLPVIGALFRSTKYQRRETELVVLITPKLIEGLNPGQVGDLPGSNWRNPSDAETMLNGDLGGDSQVDEMRDWRKKTSERGPQTKTSQFTATADGRETNNVNDPNYTTDQNAMKEENPSGEEVSHTPPPLFFGDAGFAAPVGSTSQTSAKSGENDPTSASVND
ncbi:MAG TPA: type II and III secretion system protein family protein [Tepidisphaeraceae bacterium]|nr:type II and III secretion system protein family protein [Tepidisphaeraceae bacterium]